MPIFGQVWLWSSLAFLLGALLCWLLVARPARSRVGELEAQLTTRARRQPAPERPEPVRYRDDEPSLVPGLGNRPDGDQPTRGYGLRDTPPPLPPERDRLAPYADQERPAYGDPEPSREHLQSPRPLESDPSFSFNSGLSAPPELDDQSRPNAATQYLDVSSGSLSAPPEVPVMSPPESDRGWFDDELEGDAANQAPEEQPAVPRNRHHMVEPEQYEPFDANLVDDEDTGIHEAVEEESPRSAIEDDGGTVFTQRTHPISGELIRQIDEAGKAEQAHAESYPADTADTYAEPFAEPFVETFADRLEDNLVDDLADDPAEPEVDRRERTVESEAVAPPDSPEPVFTPPEELAPAAEAAFTPPPDSDLDDLDEHPEPSEALVPPELPQEQTEVVAAVTETTEAPETPAAPANELPRRVPQANRISQSPSVSVRVEPTPTALPKLPKRVPGKPRHQVPFGVMPGSTPEPAPVALDEPAEVQRSLFEPIVPAADEGTSTPPPPHRIRQESGGRGPFGPGSAMPLPGGASPSPDFTIKASVAALRYCTPESPQFGRTVAEVWFRTAADAERVGFRPVG